MKNNDEKFRAGNIIMSPESKNLWIFVRYSLSQHKQEMLGHLVSFDSAGSSAILHVEDTVRGEICHCSDYNDDGYDSECSECHGTGSIDCVVKGLKHYVLVADNAKDYLKDLLGSALKKIG